MLELISFLHGKHSFAAGTSFKEMEDFGNVSLNDSFLFL